ncbi:uncharacterized protein LOC106960679 isoform X5 [Poecilia latipinna]|uniref:uncharacterized protein LOC106960679 isoform X5 n=1 Tax=Poecilia latipinna TaxID=48699 RepID=UPI00072ECAFC|nr:PREDICTED: uncharacterized protein LOC106960679 isoform X5 [Poecilia latipinna]
MNVSIRDLKTSDTGRYRCLLEKPDIPLQYADFDLVVTGASNTSDSNSTLGNFTSIFLSSTSVKTTAATLTQNLTSIIPKTVKQTRTTVKPKGGTDPLLYVGLSLAILIILLATALLIFCQRKNLHQQKGPPVKKDPTDFTTINTVYEEIREKDRENKPPAGEITSVYAYVQSNKPNAAESNEIYSLASKPQGQAEEEDIEYSEVQLPNGAIRSNGGHLAASDNVTYSEPRLATSSGSHGNGSPPLYSTITSQE